MDSMRGPSDGELLSRREFSRRATAVGLTIGLGLPDSPASVGSTSETGAMESNTQDGRLAEREFPHVREGIYFNHAASSPVPQRTAEALRRHVADRERLFHLYQTGTQDYSLPLLQGKVGRLLNVLPELVAFVPTTTEALSGALNGIDWRRGDHVVVPANEFPGVMYPCLHLERRGVTVRQVPVEGHVDLERVLGAIDGRTRAVAISWVHWLTGHRIDLARLGAACSASGALSIVDAIQGVGAIPVDVAAAKVDLFVAGSYKWLMGVPGTAAMYTSPRFLEQVIPDRAGHAGMRTSVHDAPRLDWQAGASRFHVGGPINAALIALEHSTDLLQEVGVARIEAHVGTLIDRLAAGARDVGLTMNSDLSPAHRSTFVNVTTGDLTRDDRLVKALVARKVIVGRRGPGIRVAPHLHNSVGDADRFLALVRELA